MKKTLTVAITCGDPNGIGPELIWRTLDDPRLLEDYCFVVYASTQLLNDYRKAASLNTEVMLHAVPTAEEAQAGKFNVVSVLEGPTNLALGQSTPWGGEVAWKSLEKATADVLSGVCDVLVTSPINKDNIQRADFAFPGHTEYLASATAAQDALMVLTSDEMRIALVTGHVPLKEVSKNLSQERIVARCELLLASLRGDFGVRKPRVAILGLNPHAGDNGLLGSEEKDCILPAVNQLSDRGHLVLGPFAADGFFGAGTFRQFDGILAMYHDQGLAPFKALTFDRGVNYTAALSIVRTSPDHGTAYGLVGKGTASLESFRNAIFLAGDVYRFRQQQQQLEANPLPIQEPKTRGRHNGN